MKRTITIPGRPSPGHALSRRLAPPPVRSTAALAEFTNCVLGSTMPRQLVREFVAQLGHDLCDLAERASLEDMEEPVSRKLSLDVAGEHGVRSVISAGTEEDSLDVVEREGQFVGGERHDGVRELLVEGLAHVVLLKCDAIGHDCGALASLGAWTAVVQAARRR